MRPSVVLYCVLTIASGCATAPQWRDLSHLVVVTIADTGAPRTQLRGYHPPGYRLSDDAQRSLTGLERDYGLRRVDGWPIDLLGVYCAVMAVNADADVDATLARVGDDPRVRMSQTLQTFVVRSSFDPYFAARAWGSPPLP
jgi:hypothetical protein